MGAQSGQINSTRVWLNVARDFEYVAVFFSPCNSDLILFGFERVKLQVLSVHRGFVLITHL